MIDRFGTLPTIDGYDVIAEDSGRPVAHRDTLASANGVAQFLNNVARSNPSDPSGAGGAGGPRGVRGARGNPKRMGPVNAALARIPGVPRGSK